MTPFNPQEIEIMKQTASGHTAKEVAKHIGLEYRTVESYLATIKKKLGAKNVVHAVYIACTNHLMKKALFENN